MPVAHGPPAAHRGPTVTRHSPKPTTSLLLVVTLDARSQPAAVPAKADIAWLEERSMLRQAGEAARGVSGKNVQWQHRYGDPQPREAVKHASVWLLDYP